MADNATSDPGSGGVTWAADDIGGGVLAARCKAVWGPDGTANDVDAASGKALPVQGDDAHDAVDYGNPIKIGGKAASTPPTAVSAADRVNAYYDLQGSQSVFELGAINIATGQVTTGAAGTLLAARATRKSMTFKNLDNTITVYIGPATVSSSNGFPLYAGDSITLTWVGLIQVVAASGSPVVAYVEEYN